MWRGRQEAPCAVSKREPITTLATLCHIQVLPRVTLSLQTHQPLKWLPNTVRKKWAPSHRQIIFLILAAVPRLIQIMKIYFSRSCCEGTCRAPDHAMLRKHDFQPSTSTLKTRPKLVQINIYPASVPQEQGSSHRPRLCILKVLLH